MSDLVSPLAFRELALPEPLLTALTKLGYETPTTIQSRTIPLLLDGRDVLGQAETGTGKTAAFALPLLSRLDLASAAPQVLVLTPTRELALQVSAAFRSYATEMRGLRVLPIYGGQEYGTQLRQLERGVHVVVGTPGRLMDLLRREALALDKLFALVIDEADEMLRMGFIDDVEWILERAPAERQTALFSATMPPAIRKIAVKHMREAEEIIAETRTTGASSIRQQYCLVAPSQKLEAFARILEVTPHEGVIVFMQTRQATLELAEALVARGHKAAPLNGDVPQRERERTVERLKNGQLDILVATDVAARGLDVDRVSHVVNFETPHDVEAYVHRIGRTGRAGRTGEAILFVAPREMRIVKMLERETRQRIAPLSLPTVDVLNQHRKARFKARIKCALDSAKLSTFRELMAEYHEESGADPLDIAAALAQLLQGETPLLVTALECVQERGFEKNRSVAGPVKFRRGGSGPEPGMERFRIAVGRVHGVRPGNIVGAIANEARLSSERIGRVQINEDHSTVDLPVGIPDAIFRKLSRAMVCNQRLCLSRASGHDICRA
jgi:ATP-dependent RNA helicase DeaD